MGPSLSGAVLAYQGNSFDIFWILTKIDSRVKSAIGTEQVQCGLAVVALTSAVHLGLCQHDNSRAGGIPLELDLVTLEKAFLRDRCIELRHNVHLDLSGLALTLRNKHCNRMGLSWGERKICHPLYAQLIPNSRQIITLVELDLVGHDAGAQLLVGSVLQVPACLRLLDILADDGVFIPALNRAPHLEVLGSVSIGVFGWPLPSDQVGTERREAQLEHVLGVDRGDNVAGTGVNNGDPVDQNQLGSSDNV